MALESATYATQLNTAYPLATDLRSQGDDHLRLIKQVVANETSPDNKEWAFTGDSVTRITDTTFVVDGDQTSVYKVGRRLKLNSSFGVITNVTASANTAVSVSMGVPVPTSPLAFVGQQQTRNLKVEYGLLGDGETDETTALAAALAQGGGWLPAGSYKVSAELVMDVIGTVLHGDGGVSGRTKIIATHTNGAVFRPKIRSCGLVGIQIDSDGNRQSATSVVANRGIFYGDDDVVSQGSMSRGFFEDVYIQRQPSDGFHVAGGFELSWVRNMTIADCNGHGVVMDAGDEAGRTNISVKVRPFHFIMNNVRVIECGGNGWLLGGATIGITGGLFNNCEALGNNWNSATRNSLYQIDMRGDGCTWLNPDVEDQQYAATTTSSTGSARTGNATPAHGFRISSGRIVIVSPYFSSLLSCVYTNSAEDFEVLYPQIYAGTYGVNQTVGINVDSTTLSGLIKAGTARTAGATKIWQTQSVYVSAKIDGREYRGTTTTAAAFAVDSVPVEYTLSSGVLTTTSDRVLLVGEGDTTDSLETIRYTATVNGEPGDTVTLVNENSYTITVVDTTGNIRTNTGSNVALSQYRGMTLQYSEALDGWVQVG